MARLRFDFSLPAHRKRFRVLVLCLLALLAGVFLAQWWYLSSFTRNWDSIDRGEKQSLTAFVQSSFAIFQNEAVDVVRTVTQDTVITLALRKGSSSNKTLFERLQSLNANDFTIELFNSSKSLECWKGNEGIQTDTSWLKQEMHSFVAQGPIYSFLIVTNTLRIGTRTAGYVVVKRLFDVQYPISNRFINEDVFTTTFTSRFDLDADFDFSPVHSSKASEDVQAIQLTDIHGKRIGDALLHPSSLDDRERSLRTLFANTVHALLFLLLLVLLLGISSIERMRRNRTIQVLFGAGSLWVIRYVLVAIDFPSAFFHMDIFDPSFFASSFGFGIVKSIGDLFLTSVCLLVTVAYIMSSILKTMQEGNERPANRTVTAVLVILASLGFPLLLRGFAAAIHSAVFDSTLNYTDPMYIVPPFQICVMLLGLFFIALALVIFYIVSLIQLKKRITGFFKPSMTSIGSWLILAVVFTGGSILIGIIHPNQLFDQGERIAYLAGFLFCALLIAGTITASRSLFHVKTIALFLVAGVAALVFPLEKKVHESDRSHIEFLASNIFRPADSYLSILTQQSLRELSASEFADGMTEENPTILKKLAFKAWAQSILSREGYNCAVTYFDTKGSAVSTFYIGANWKPASIQRDSLAVTKIVTIEERTEESHVVRIYRGYTPLLDESGSLLGGVSVEVSAGRQALLGGETPEFLRNYPAGEIEARHRIVVYSEYINGELTYSSSPVFPPGTAMPVVHPITEDSPGFWNNQIVNAEEYETFFFKTEGITGQSNWSALSMPALDIGWQVYDMSRVAFFLGICSLAAACITWLVLFTRGKRIGFSFRTKLVTAFFIVALIPTAILAYYNRQYASDRIQQSVQRQLEGETTTIASALQSQWGVFTPFDLSGFTDQDAVHAANDFNIPFTLFTGAYESASSTPELFRAELFDRRMMADAYLNTVILKKSFYFDVQSIGTLQYIVGYHPLLTEAGKVFAIVAVPTLFRLQEMDDVLVRRNAYLFGAFVFAMMIALLVAILFSQQISSPVRRLYLATRRIGAGDFNVDLHSDRADELGELERAFNAMLTDLKRSQEDIIQAQRELAWKEMAKQVAHEIKNPLTPMKLSLQHLRQAHADGVEDFDKLIEQVSTTILEQIETLSRIASEFSHFARMPERIFEEIDLHRIMRDVTILFGEYKRVTFDLQFCPNSAIIWGDKEELRRAFMNIVRNSVQAMNEHGVITIQTNLEGTTAHISITDSGPGIAPEIRNRLFEPNFSTKTDGMGLGLAIVKKTIDDLGGTIAIESKPGAGASVHISLPVARII